MDTKQSTSIMGELTTSASSSASMPANLPAEDGVMRIGVTRIGHAYIFERGNPNPTADSDLLFHYDLAGNQIRREVEAIG